MERLAVWCKHDQEEKWEKIRRAELALFSNLLEEIDCKLEHRARDGNCLYRAFAWALFGDLSRYLKIRADLADYVILNKKRFRPFEPEIDQKITNQLLDGSWGDILEIIALSEMFNVGVRVFQISPSQKLWISFDN